MIGGWFKKKKKDRIEQSEERVELPFSTDLHSHLIPGIDDGVKTLQESLGLLKGLEELGYRRIYTTPHIMSDSYRNSSATIREGLADLRRSATEKGLTLEIDAAAEYYLDELLFERLEQGDILTIGRDLLLFETSYYNEPLQLEERIYEISARGYRPLMAHPERYRYVKDPEKFYGRLRSLGVSFQVNINSLGGYYGSDAREKAVWLARRGWIDYLGSDMHGARQLEFLRKSFKNKAFYEAIDNNNVLNDIIL